MSSDFYLRIAIFTIPKDRIMKIIITSTPEFPLVLLQEVIDLLNETKGELEFQLGEPLNSRQFSLSNSQFKEPDKIQFLSFDELFGLCETYRTFKEIDDDVFVVMITNIPNNKYWFSNFNGKDIFVHGLGWEIFTNQDASYSIAFQIIENVFQSMINIDTTNPRNEPNIHMEPIGCINDMCADKTKVFLKLQSARICDSCIDRAEEEYLDDKILVHIDSIISNLRNVYTSSNRIKSKLKPPTVRVDDKATIFIGNHQLKLNPLHKGIFLFFLKNIDGVRTKSVSDYVEEIYTCYNNVKKSEAEKRIIENIFIDDTLSVKLGEIRKELRTQLGENLAKFYTIDSTPVGDDNFYKMKITPDCTDIDPRF